MGIDKKVIRALSADRDLPTAEKPEMACLASRFPTGTPITITGLGRVATAEALIASLGFSQYRVRFHDDLARIEIPPDELSRALEPELRATIIDGLKAAGFRWVTIDLDGYTRGSSNAVAMAREVTR